MRGSFWHLKKKKVLTTNFKIKKKFSAMPAKLSTICYVVECAERLTRNFTVKDVTAVTRLSEQDPTKVSYLRVKAFVPLDEEVEHNIDEFGKDDVIYLKGKFVGCDDWYSVRVYF